MSGAGRAGLPGQERVRRVNRHKDDLSVEVFELFDVFLQASKHQFAARQASRRQPNSHRSLGTRSKIRRSTDKRGSGDGLYQCVAGDLGLP